MALDKMGTYMQNSEWSNSKAAKWSPPFDRFFVPKMTPDENPGPGTHEQYGELKYGKQVNSKYHSTLTPSFGIGDRAAWARRF